MSRKLHCLKHRETGEIVHTYAPRDYDPAEWVKHDGGHPHKLSPKAKRQARVHALGPVGRYEELLGIIEALEARVKGLENAARRS